MISGSSLFRNLGTKTDLITQFSFCSCMQRNGSKQELSLVFFAVVHSNYPCQYVMVTLLGRQGETAHYKPDRWPDTPMQQVIPTYNMTQVSDSILTDSVGPVATNAQVNPINSLNNHHPIDIYSFVTCL